VTVTVMRRKSIAGILLAVVLTVCGCAGNRENSPSDAAIEAPAALVVKAAPVRAQEWIVAISVSGSLRSQSMVEVKVEVGGRLIATHFEEGSSIQKGQLLAEMDTANYQLAYNQARAVLGVAEAGLERVRVMLEHARREKERADNLVRTGGITQKDHEAALTNVKDADTQVHLAEAQIEQARAALSIAEKALRDCRILAPAAGRVQRKYFHEGSLLVPGSSICSLVDNTRLEFECNLPSYQLSEVRPGQAAFFTTPTWGERRFEGRVHSINPVIESESRAVRLIVKIANPGEELRSGMFAGGDIEVRRQAGALVIPRSAFMANQSGRTSGSVYVVEGGFARRRAAEVVDSRRDALWVRNGVNAGELVIVEIGPALKDGSAVRVAGNSTEVK